MKTVDIASVQEAAQTVQAINHLSYYHAARLLDTVSDSLPLALQAVRKAWEDRNPGEDPGAGVQCCSEESHRRGGASEPKREGVLKGYDSRPRDGLDAPPIPSGMVLSSGESLNSAGHSARAPNKSSVNLGSLKATSLFDTYSFDGRPIGDVRRGELKAYVKRGSLAQAILDYGEAPDGFMVRDIMKPADLRKIMLKVGVSDA